VNSLSSRRTFPELTITVAAAIVLTLGGSSYGQCPGVCGDINGSGGISFPDLIGMLGYTQSANWPIGNDTLCANVDGHPGITMRDLCILGDELYWTRAEPDCDLDPLTYVPMANSDHFLHYNSLFPPGDTIVTLYLDITTPDRPRRTMGVGLSIHVQVGAEDATIGAVTPPVVEDPPDWWYQTLRSSSSTNIPPSHLLGSYVKWEPGGAVFGRQSLGSAQLIMPPADSYRTITVALVDVPQGGHNATMAVEDQTYDGWELNLSPLIFGLTGDANNDRALTAADIIVLVNYVFKGGPSPYPIPAAGDVDCSSAVTSADIIHLVNHVFKGGPAPCAPPG